MSFWEIFPLSKRVACRNVELQVHVNYCVCCVRMYVCVCVYECVCVCVCVRVCEAVGNVVLRT